MPDTFAIHVDFLSSPRYGSVLLVVGNAFGASSTHMVYAWVRRSIMYTHRQSILSVGYLYQRSFAANGLVLPKFLPCTIQNIRPLGRFLPCPSHPQEFSHERQCLSATRHPQICLSNERTNVFFLSIFKRLQSFRLHSEKIVSKRMYCIVLFTIIGEMSVYIYIRPKK